jgi:hypothetical protein
MSKPYRYVGPEQIRARVAEHSAGTPVNGAADVVRWTEQTGQRVARDEILAATFVIDPSERLLIADRHSEHVACAGGGDVLAAGELFFSVDGKDVSIEQVSNQSTGYCPEAESWAVVVRVLDRIGLAHPEGFTTVCIFRRCTHCGERNIVKDDWFVCDVCGGELDRQWNFDC